MTEFKKYPPNTFCWPELMTTDPKKARKFYGEVFGWEVADTDMGGGMTYSMVMLRDKSVGAMYQQMPDQEKMGIPSNWLSYVSVNNMKESFDKAVTLGATPMQPPMDVADYGKAAVLTDPVGAMFALWEPGNAIGSDICNEPGSLTWNELHTTDIDRSGAFYTKLFNWTAQTADMGGMQYTSFMNGDRPNGGMMALQKELGNTTPNWLTYFAVADCDASVKKITAGGGTILSPAMDLPEVGRFAVAADPTDAVFAIIKLANPM